jgi:ribosomal protein S18 acetylase RimI-like enzyme
MGKFYKMDAAPTSIIRAESQHCQQIADILADAFANDPVMNWVIPNKALYEPFYRIMLRRLFIDQEHTFVETEGRGAAMWLPPGVSFEIPMNGAQMGLIARLILTRGPRVIKRLLAVQETMARHHPRTPHYYLQSVGARQAHQGQGVGSTLLKHLTPQIDAAHMPAYLESSSERNVPLYERHGFEIFAEEKLGGAGPPMWFMLRPAR